MFNFLLWCIRILQSTNVTPLLTCVHVSSVMCCTCFQKEIQNYSKLHFLNQRFSGINKWLYLNLKFKLYLDILNLQVENVTYLRWRSPRFVTVCDRGGEQFVKSSVCIRYEQPLISKITITQIQYFNVQQILVVTFEFKTKFKTKSRRTGVCFF